MCVNYNADKGPIPIELQVNLNKYNTRSSQKYKKYHVNKIKRIRNIDLLFKKKGIT